MAHVNADRVQETSTTTGAGTYTLAGAIAGFQSFAAIGNGNTCWYCATNGVDWEVGLGTYASSGTTLARTTILASSNSGSAVSWSAGTKQVFVTFPASRADVRERLTANRTYYVRTDGNDSNTGLVNSSGGAFLTVQKALDTLAAIDLTYNVTIQLADGTYSGDIRGDGPWLGKGTVSIVGNTTTPANVILTSGTTIQVRNGCRLSINGVEIQASSIGLSALYNGVILIGNNIRFGACTNYHIESNLDGIVQGGNYAIVGNAAVHLFLSGGKAEYVANAITLSGTRTFTYFVWAFDLAFLSHYSTTWTGGTVTGKRYQAERGAVINTFGGGSNVFPGNSAGTATGAYYA